MEVDDAFIGETTATGDVDLQRLIDELIVERDYLREQNQRKCTELANSRALADNRWGTIERLTTQLQAQRREASGELYVTAATCKVYHRNRNCYHIRTNNSVRAIRPCHDCAGNH